MCACAFHSPRYRSIPSSGIPRAMPSRYVLLFSTGNSIDDEQVNTQMTDELCQQAELVLAFGTISPPQHGDRRMAQRLTWMRWPNVGNNVPAPICGAFIVRSGGTPRRQMATLLHERASFRDTLLADTIAWNESRVRGPVLSLAWWLEYANRVLGHAQFIGKIDDDSYIHAPDLEALLRQTRLAAGSEALVFLGVLTYYHWYPRLFDNTRHGWSYGAAFEAGRWCRTNDLRLPAHIQACGADGCGRCIGPFVFASGFLIILSRTLAGALVTGGRLQSDALALRRLDTAGLPDKSGKVQTQVMEDVWLGSILYRFPPPQPVTYVSLLGGRTGLYVDTWDLRLTRSALLVHVITKQPARLFALHTLIQQPSMHCTKPFHVRCDGSGVGMRRARAATGGRWCRVMPASMDGPRASPTIDRQACCSGSKNTSCSAVFGSNRWAQPFARIPNLAAQAMRCIQKPPARGIVDPKWCLRPAMREIQATNLSIDELMLTVAPRGKSGGSLGRSHGHRAGRGA